MARFPTIPSFQSRIRSRPLLPAQIVIRLAIALAGAMLVGAPASALVRADAPALAVTLADVELLAEPVAGSSILAEIPTDTEVELTGEAAPGYVEIIFDRRRGWVAAALLDAGSGRGVPLATAARSLEIRDAPLPEGKVLGSVPRGGTVILTGAEVDGYLAAAYRGTGGWLPAAGLQREESAAHATEICSPL
jgi:hypothetical protein